MPLWTARQIWMSLPRERREAAALSLWEDENLTRAARAACLAPWLTARGMRPAFLEQMPRARRAQLMADGGMPDETAVQILMSYHIRHQRALLGRFLDELGVEHENGLIKEGVQPDPPAPEKLQAAVDAIRAEFPPAEVDLYLRTLSATDADTWQNLAAIIAAPA
jgi:hypothetical protein